MKSWSIALGKPVVPVVNSINPGWPLFLKILSKSFSIWFLEIVLNSLFLWSYIMDLMTNAFALNSLGKENSDGY